MAIHKLFSKILLIQTYHTTCVSFSCQFSIDYELTGVKKGYDKLQKQHFKNGTDVSLSLPVNKLYGPK